MQKTTDNGMLLEKFDYTPFGGIVNIDNEYIGFASEISDNCLKMTYFNYRFFIPAIGRWTRIDPIADKGCINLLIFTDNNPINYFDLYGLDPYRNQIIRERRRRKEEEYKKRQEWLRYLLHKHDNDLCCINGVLEPKKVDDAGLMCCRDKISSISIRVQKGKKRNLRDWGHAFLYIENEGTGSSNKGIGFYIDFEWLGFKKFQDETVSSFDYSFDYKVCPITKAAIMTEISIDVNYRRPIYIYPNIIGNNCYGIVCRWVEKGGLKPPFPPDTWFLRPIQD